MKTKDILLKVTFAFYICFLLWNIVFKLASPLEIFSQDRIYYREVNVVPFRDQINPNGDVSSLDLYGNVILFIPLGVYIMMLNKDKNVIRNVLYIALMSIALEASQFIFALGGTDITDVITNTCGGIIGIGIYKLLELMLKKEERINKFVTISATVVMLGTAALLTLLMVSN